MKHGTYAEYVYHKCRCAACTDANRQYHAKRRAERYSEAKDHDDSRHGTTSFYDNHGCRCDNCKSAAKARRATYYQRNVQAAA